LNKSSQSDFTRFSNCLDKTKEYLWELGVYATKQTLANWGRWASPDSIVKYKDHQENLEHLFTHYFPARFSGRDAGYSPDVMKVEKYPTPSKEVARELYTLYETLLTWSSPSEALRDHPNDFYNQALPKRSDKKWGQNFKRTWEEGIYIKMSY
jgi:hypothetical protein